MIVEEIKEALKGTTQQTISNRKWFVMLPFAYNKFIYRRDLHPLFAGAWTLETRVC